jgi:phosphoenolpyruvate synthase/pyruvate phosphate dikinase
LNRLFPGRVAPAIALPFGVFADHVGAGADAPLTRLADAYAARRRDEIDAATLASTLAELREAITSVRLKDDLLATLLPMMKAEFGDPGGYGIFVRSDTNVEDLPGFTGAGLNETVPNVRGLDAQLATIPRVWASVLSPRAIAWRSELLTNPADVFASVLLMKSVPSEKSGVLVTTDLAGRGAGLTVSTAWGVGGAVAGEAAETLTLLADGSERLISEAKAPYQRYLADEGAVGWRRAASGPVLTDSEKRVLRNLAEEVGGKYETVSDGDGRTLPWDIEFGFVDGELTLFQIRPLVERGQRRADRALLAAIGPARPIVDVVPLDSLPVDADTAPLDKERSAL